MFPIRAYGDHTIEFGRYWINEYARVWDNHKNREVKVGYRKSAKERAARPKQRYKRVQLRTHDGKKISCLLHVLMYFAANPHAPRDVEIDHRDTDTENNALSNLQALTFTEHRTKTKAHRGTITCSATFPAKLAKAADPHMTLFNADFSKIEARAIAAMSDLAFEDHIEPLRGGTVTGRFTHKEPNMEEKPRAYTFPNHAIIPTKEAVFDDSELKASPEAVAQHEARVRDWLGEWRMPTQQLVTVTHLDANSDEFRKTFETFRNALDTMRRCRVLTRAVVAYRVFADERQET